MTDQDAATPVTAPEGASVQSYPYGWHLVEKGGWQVSVSPDGLVMLPRHLHPREAADFFLAAAAAAEVAGQVVAINDKKTTRQPTAEELKQVGNVIVAEGDPPPGAVRMRTTPRSAQQGEAAIGRPRQRDPRAPRNPAPPTPPQPPIPGGQRART